MLRLIRAPNSQLPYRVLNQRVVVIRRVARLGSVGVGGTSRTMRVQCQCSHAVRELGVRFGQYLISRPVARRGSRAVNAAQRTRRGGASVGAAVVSSELAITNPPTSIDASPSLTSSSQKSVSVAGAISLITRSA
jgi:hypothetical protein